MDSKTLVKVLKKVVREEVRSVIKEELTEILQEGLQSTIDEMTLAENAAPVSQVVTPRKNKAQFKKNKFSDILNETETLRERPSLNEQISMTSADAQGFGIVREKLRAQISGIYEQPAIITDPQTGQTIQAKGAVAKAMTRDYSALMKAMDKKKNKG